MSIRRVVPNIPSSRIETSRKFYTDLLGFDVAMDMGWIVTLASPSNPTAQLSLVLDQAATPAEPVSLPRQEISLTVEVLDVDAAHAKATAMGIQMIYPLTNEPWGVRRFHVVDPNGVVINVMSHLK